MLVPGAATFNAMRTFFSSSNLTAGADPIASLSNSDPKLLVNVLSMPGQDMTGCLSNCTNRGTCTLNNNNKFVCGCQEYFIGIYTFFIRVFKSYIEELIMKNAQTTNRFLFGNY